MPRNFNSGLICLIGGGLIAFMFAAQPMLAAAQTVQPTVRTVGLLAAVGDQFQYVRQKPSVGSNMDPYIRKIVSLPDQTLNKMVLRGMDRAVATQYPGAEIVMMMLTPDPPELNILPQHREAHTMERVRTLLQTRPGRENWDEIVVVTPTWLRAERDGMGAKLSGIGLYVQPLASNRDMLDGGAGLMDDEIRDIGTHKQPRSSTYVAPYFYTQVTVLDAKTLRVIRTDARFDYRKMINSDSAAVDVAKSFTPEQLSAEIEKFVETAARRLLVDKDGSIEIGPVRTLPAPVK